MREIPQRRVLVILLGQRPLYLRSKPFRDFPQGYEIIDRLLDLQHSLRAQALQTEHLALDRRVYGSLHTLPVATPMKRT
jgi:hypothetical protein